MVLSTPEYLCFLVLVFLGFWSLASSRRNWAIGLVALANLFFYFRWGWIYLAAMPVAASLDYFLGKAIPTKRWLIWISVLVNLALLVLPKVPETGLLLKLSLSFYAFQALSYTIDIYRGDAKPSTSWLRHLTSVTFFPTTLQGPITRVNSLIPQWDKAKLTPADGGRALFLIGLGAAKKFLIADYLGENLINRIFDGPALYSGFECFVGVVAYAFQLYYDFSGYTDIALGSALLLGIKLPPNFNRPYEALNIAEFWRKWHISLSNWLRDYLYYALPGQRSQAMQYVNLALTMVLGGLWHGFSINFVIWGTLHGVGLAVARWWQLKRGKKPYSSLWIARFARGATTFLYVLLGWVFFRAESLDAAKAVLAQIAIWTFGYGNISTGFAVVLGVAIAAHYWPKDWYAKAQQTFAASPALVQAAVLTIVVACIQYVGATGSAPFVYQKF
jgi:D-alanyl-lipoteichoic acid acyltransferase DltB (MBOAT superfamily)